MGLIKIDFNYTQCEHNPDKEDLINISHILDFKIEFLEIRLQLPKFLGLISSSISTYFEKMKRTTFAANCTKNNFCSNNFSPTLTVKEKKLKN